MKIKIALALTLLVLALSIGRIGVKNLDADAATVSAGECVIEVSSRRILSETNGEKRLPLASTTKILTAIMIIDDCDLEETVRVPAVAAGVEGSSVYLKAGETITVRDLLYGLMLRSGNDCAVTLAVHHSGSVEAFARRMCEKAVFLGAEGSHFVNPHGLPDERHYTCARDLALISAYAMENETFREIVSAKLYSPKGWVNKNKMLTGYDGAIGVKTGFTKAAGRCLVTAAERDGMRIVSVVLNSPQMYERSAELLDNAFAKYTLVTLYRSGEPLDCCAGEQSFSYPLTEEEQGNVHTETEIYERSGSLMPLIGGIMKIYLENRLLFSQNLYMMKQ